MSIKQIDSMELVQAAVYFAQGTCDYTARNRTTLTALNIGQLSEFDEGFMSINYAKARIVKRAVEIAYLDCEGEPAEGTVFEDLMGECLPNIFTHPKLLEKLSDSSLQRSQKWNWVELLLRKFIAMWHHGVADEFCVQTFVNENWRNRYRVQIEYFKPSGKFYSEAYFYTEKESWLDVRDELNYLLKNDPPGLSVFDEQFMVYMNSDEHPMGFPIIRNPVGN